MSSNNVIDLFSKNKKSAKSDVNIIAPTLEEMGSDLSTEEISRLEQVMINARVNLVSRQMANAVLRIMEETEIKQNEVDATQDFYMVVETIMSLLFKLNNTYHPIQDISKNCVSVLDDGGVRFDCTLADNGTGIYFGYDEEE